MSDAQAQNSPLADLLDVREIESGLYRGPQMPEARGRVFGGQALGQALMAAVRGMDRARVVHAAHAHFIRGGVDDLPIFYRVTPEFEGRAFAIARVMAYQAEQLILTMTVSFQRPEEGLFHQAPMPDVPGPEHLARATEIARPEHDPDARMPRIFSPHWPVDIRPVEADSIVRTTPGEPCQYFWFRAVDPLGDDPDMHRAVIAFCADMAMLTTALQPHGIPLGASMLQTASLDHAMWFHESARADEWLLHAMDSPWSGHARGFNRGTIFTRDGRVVASTAQEALIRLRR